MRKGVEMRMENWEFIPDNRKLENTGSWGFSVIAHPYYLLKPLKNDDDDYDYENLF